jgi:hypothetical protein
LWIIQLYLFFYIKIKAFSDYSITSGGCNWYGFGFWGGYINPASHWWLTAKIKMASSSIIMSSPLRADGGQRAPR